MKDRTTHVNQLLRSYHAYLADFDSARFISGVAKSYSIATLSRLAVSGNVLSRRATALALGMIGTTAVNDILGQMLSDPDRKVRLVADDSMKGIWARACSPRHRLLLDGVLVYLENERFDEAIQAADDLIAQHDRIPDAFSQRGIAKFYRHDFRSALNDCYRTVELNRHHYIAWVGMGHCYLELSQPFNALDCFRHALKIFPDLEPVRLQIRRLERSLKDS